MKRETREEKAITLIALIITIVVLLILAVVAINAVTGDGIIQHAVNAKTDYEKAQAKENGILAYYEQYLNTQSGSGPWKQDGNRIYMSDSEGKTIELQIGDKVEYDEKSNGVKSYSISYTENGGSSSSDSQSLTTQDLEWRVLGINDKGQLELISTQPTGEREGEIERGIYLKGETGYLNAQKILNTSCNELYGKGEGAESARSLNTDDIDKLAGISTEADKQELYTDYGNWWRYEYNTTSGKIQYSKSTDYNPGSNPGTWSTPVDTSNDIFKEPGKTEINRNNSKDATVLKYTAYSYKISTKIPSTLTTPDGILISDLITNGLSDRNDSGDSTIKTQWLASYCLAHDTNVVGFYVRYVSAIGRMGGSCLCSSDGGFSDNCYDIRPVVTLKSNVQIVDTNGNGIPEVK